MRYANNHISRIWQSLKTGNTRIALVKSGDHEEKFVFKTMDLDQAGLFSTQCPGDVREDMNL